MQQIKTKPYILNAENATELLDRLLGVHGYTRDSFAAYMGVESATLDDNPKWAINYLSDLLEVDLIHLGYVAKDVKAEGIFGEYDATVGDLKEAQNERGDTQQPLIINKDYILSSVRTLKISIVANTDRLNRDYLNTLPPLEQVG